MSDKSVQNNSLHNTLSRLIPFQSFRLKILAVAFFAIQIPFLAIIGYLLLHSEEISRLQIIIVILTATVIGTSIALWVLYYLVQPVSLISDTLKGYAKKGRINLADSHDKEFSPVLREIDDILRKIDGRTKTLEELAFNDYLTELPNRRYAEDRLHSEVSLCERNRIALAIAMLDVDFFKHINDTHGHVVGDDVLVQLAKYISHYLRRESEWTARWGGEEFIIVLFSSIDEAKNLMESLREALMQHTFRSDGISHQLTVSIGLAEHQSGDSIKVTIKKADTALYQAKAVGRNTVIVWREEKT